MSTLLPLCRLALLAGLLSLSACQPATPPASAPVGSDFRLQTSQGGQRVELDSRQLRGQVLLLFFGYTHCPDVCPAAMAVGAQALKLLGDAERQRVQLILISVDPERDTPEKLATYSAYFHPAMRGASGSPEAIAALARAFGAGYVRQPPRPDGSYVIDHTASIYLVGPDGRLQQVLDPGSDAEAVAAAVRKWL
ncbi:MAG: hypothetical protein RIR00_1303 [Pseudomonadota bacterium]|jgi:protein SCO1/2